MKSRALGNLENHWMEPPLAPQTAEKLLRLIELVTDDQIGGHRPEFPGTGGTRKITSCRICGDSRLAPVVDLGEMPPAHRLLRPEELGRPERSFPLRAVLCEDCGLVQLEEEIPVQFRDHPIADYEEPSQRLSHHARRLARSLSEKYHLGRHDLILDVASKDGSVLRAFQERKLQVSGIEPSARLAAIAQEEGIDTIVGAFAEPMADRLRKEVGRAKLVLARNVLPGTSELHAYVRGVKHVLAEDGVAIIEVSSLTALYENLEFDDIQHRHLHYFSLAAIRMLFEGAGMKVIDVERVQLNGGRLLVHAVHEAAPAQSSLRVAVVLRQEERLQLKQPAAWLRFAESVARAKEDLLWFINDEAMWRGFLLAGYGAGPKGNTLLSYCGIGPQQLAYIVDADHAKHGCFTPGHHIPVRSPEQLLQDVPDVTLLLNGHDADTVIARHLPYQRLGGRFALPIPEPRLCGILGIAA